MSGTMASVGTPYSGAMRFGDLPRVDAALARVDDLPPDPRGRVRQPDPASGRQVQQHRPRRIGRLVEHVGDPVRTPHARGRAIGHLSHIDTPIDRSCAIMGRDRHRASAPPRGDPRSCRSTVNRRFQRRGLTMGFGPGTATRQKQWRLVAATALLGVAIAALVSMAATPMYTATTTTFVSVLAGLPASVSTAYTDSLLAQQRVKSYADVVPSDAVMSGVIDDLGLPMSPSALAEQDRRQQPGRHGDPGDLGHRPEPGTGAVDRERDGRTARAGRVRPRAARRRRRTAGQGHCRPAGRPPGVAVLPTHAPQPGHRLWCCGLAAGGVAALAWGRLGPRPDATVGAAPVANRGPRTSRTAPDAPSVTSVTPVTPEMIDHASSWGERVPARDAAPYAASARGRPADDAPQSKGHAPWT